MRKFLTKVILVLLGILLPCIALETTCYFLNHSSWKDRFHFNSYWGDFRTDRPSAKRLYEIQSSSSELPLQDFPKQNSLIDHSLLTADQMYSGGSLESESEGFIAPLPSSTWRSLMTNRITGEVIYDTNVVVDEFRRRVTPESKIGPELRKYHAVFLGCSYIWGQGVEDNETLPYYFEQASSSYRAYNMGFPGEAPNGLIARLRKWDAHAGVKEDEGIGIYVFIPDHVKRVVGPMSFVTSWGTNYANFVESPSGELTQQGTFKTGHPFLFPVFQFLSRLETVKFFHIDIPPTLGEKQVRLFSKAVLLLRTEYLNRFPRSKFIVLFWPGSGGFAEQIIPYLEQSGIQYLDYSNLPLMRLTAGPASLKDGHPSKFSYELIGKQLATDLRLF